MRSLIFFSSVLALIIAGYFLKTDACSGAGKVSTESIDELKSIFPGKWKLEYYCKSSNSGWKQDGDVIYLANGRFQKQVSVKYYNDCGGFSDPFRCKEVAIYGGRVFGEVTAISTSIWKENTLLCNLSEGFVESKTYREQFNPCRDLYSHTDTIYYGNFTNDSISFSVVSLSEDKIVLKGKKYNDASEITYKLTRLLPHLDANEEAEVATEINRQIQLRKENDERVKQANTLKMQMQRQRQRQRQIEMQMKKERQIEAEKKEKIRKPPQVIISTH